MIRSGTEWNTPRRIALLVSSANHRSIRAGWPPSGASRRKRGPGHGVQNRPAAQTRDRSPARTPSRLALALVPVRSEWATQSSEAVLSRCPNSRESVLSPGRHGNATKTPDASNSLQNHAGRAPLVRAISCMMAFATGDTGRLISVRLLIWVRVGSLGRGCGSVCSP
jgi:hypothetical protein